VKIEEVLIGDLKADPRNARKHGKRNLEAIKASLKRFGLQKPIVIDAENKVVAGNGTLAAALELGWARISAVRTELVGVRQSAFSIADNKTAELAEWDADPLAELIADIRLQEEALLDSIGFSDKELEAILPTGTQEEQPLPEPPADPITKPGDLWILGKHRLLCGDATKKDDVERLLGEARPGLMVTDPPYGVEYDPDWRNEATRPDGTPYGASSTGEVQNDDKADWREAYALFPGAVAYVWHASLYVGIVAGNLEDSEFQNRSQLIWKKPRFAISRGHYHWQHESCLYAVRKGQTAHWCGDRSQSTIWEIDLAVSEDKNNHGTQKPIECMARPMRNHDFPEVYDPFLGSGTTLIAAEQLGRVCYGIEIDPVYSDVVVQRWVNLTGGTPVREDGTPFK
jgi:DNA modification methylase